MDVWDRRLLTVQATGRVGIGTAAPRAQLHVVGLGVISDGDGYAVPNNRMAKGSLTIGSLTTSFGGGVSWTPNTAGLLLETAANTEIAVHDSLTRVASIVYYEGESANRLTIGRDMGCGPISTVAVNGNLGAGTATPASTASRQRRCHRDRRCQLGSQLAAGRSGRQHRAGGDGFNGRCGNTIHRLPFRGAEAGLTTSA